MKRDVQAGHLREWQIKTMEIQQQNGRHNVEQKLH